MFDKYSFFLKKFFLIIFKLKKQALKTRKIRLQNYQKYTLFIQIPYITAVFILTTTFFDITINL